ncbi:aldehyde dehydrogenase family protein [Lewinella cohaerens]|uniref:aldehyde dehydrogenase family protein n=1 Tax=Lewinella cohaerens TaxID=70995 RepID=UPI00037D0B13|nr:aldehyde dehydrogenase family protein [Lewinella cohaerens]
MIEQQYDIKEVDRIFDLQRRTENLQRMKNTTAAERLEHIAKIEKYILNEENQTRLAKAMWYDLRKSREEMLATEIIPILTILVHIKRQLKAWMRPQRAGAPLAMLGISSYVRYEPKGQVLLIAPWNYPFQLAINPLLHAIAAGNVCIVKPSEISAATSSFIKNMVQDLFDENEVAVIEGDVPVSQALLDKPFHHIFFTGSPAVGKIVMKAASKHLTSVTLELGGKSPCIIDETANVNVAAERIAWGKLLNNGQTCIAPDYVLVHESQKTGFLNAYQAWVEKSYNSDQKGIQASPYYTRIINEKNFHRVKNLIDDAVAKGAQLIGSGETDADDKFIAPCLLDQVTTEMTVMQEEIFGPVLPVITYRDLSEVPAFIHQLPKPLALYIMSKSRKNQEYLLSNTTAGGTAINELMITTLNPELPFGGVNNSGIGKSNGKHSFIEFSNERGVMKRRFLDFKMLFPPYKTTIFEWMTKAARL